MLENPVHKRTAIGAAIVTQGMPAGQWLAWWLGEAAVAFVIAAASTALRTDTAHQCRVASAYCSPTVAP